MSRPGSVDYVIVGAGSAGCTLASRLTESSGVRVLLLEAGGWDRDPWIAVPIGWSRLVQKRAHDWMYVTEPEPHLDFRRFTAPRGKVIGGSSSINGMLHVRGHRGDYDRWAARGLTDWSFAHLLPYFRRQESWEGGESDFRGGSGPLKIRTSHYDDPLVAAYVAAGRAAGFPVTDDYNGAVQEGFALPQATIDRGRRSSAARAYLHPALARQNLAVEVGAEATRILFDGNRASGIEYRVAGETKIARAEREIILAAGTFNSPKLLMLSGVGDPAELAAHGIASTVALPGVGKNLQEHIGAGIRYRRAGAPGRFHGHMRFDRLARGVARAHLFGTGFAADLPFGWIAFLKSRAELPLPDLQLFFRATSPDAAPYFSPFKPAYEDGFVCRAMMLRPESRGTVSLGSADPTAPVRIHQNFLADARDRTTLRDGLRLVRDLGRRAPLSGFVAAELSPGPDVTSDADLDAYIRASATSVFHGVGTCRMGNDDSGAVVDADLRVRGAEGLRVVDASVMPDLVGGNINAAVTMIAEKAADLIAGRAPPPPAKV